MVFLSSTNLISAIRVFEKYLYVVRRIYPSPFVVCASCSQAVRARREERGGRADAHRAGRSGQKSGKHQHERKK